MGFLDLPSPLFDAADGALASLLSPLWRLWVWGVVGGAASMGLYWLLSPQQRIVANKQQLTEAQRALNRFDGEFNEAAPLMKRMLGLAFKQVGIVTVPALIAMLPVLSLLAWMSTSFAHRWPAPGSEVTSTVRPETFGAEWLAGEDSARVRISDPAGTSLLERDMPAPVPLLHKRQWWNALLGNPAGYLPDGLAVESVEFELPEREYLNFGPGWLRGWEFSFLLAVFVGALALKLGFRIE